MRIQGQQQQFQWTVMGCHLHDLHGARHPRPVLPSLHIAVHQ